MLVFHSRSFSSVPNRGVCDVWQTESICFSIRSFRGHVNRIVILSGLKFCQRVVKRTRVSSGSDKSWAEKKLVVSITNLRTVFIFSQTWNLCPQSVYCSKTNLKTDKTETTLSRKRWKLRFSLCVIVRRLVFHNIVFEVESESRQTYRVKRVISHNVFKTDPTRVDLCRLEILN